jgi:hypothetical protein
MRGMASADEFLRRMEEVQAARAEAFKPLAEILAERAQLLDRLAQLEEPYGKAYATAQAGGWHPEELADLGAEEPVRRPKGRPRGRRSTPRKPSSEAAAAVPEVSAPDVVVPAQDAGGSLAEAAAGTSA